MIYRLSDAYIVTVLGPQHLSGPYPTWFRDQEVCRFNSHGKFPRPLSYFSKYIEDDRTDRVVWAIEHTTDGHVGNIALQNLQFVDRNAEFAIIIGNKAHWGKGVGKLAGRQLLEHGFQKLNLERIYCGTAATNLGMQKLACALGMEHEGTRHRHLFLNGAWVDVVEFGILRDDWTTRAQP